MGLLSGFLQGAGQGLGVMGGAMLKDIQQKQDDEMYLRRAKVLADIQRESERNRMADADEFKNDPGRVARDREQGIQNQLAGMDPRLTSAKVAATNAEVSGTADVKAKAAGQVKRAESDNSIRDLTPGQESYRGDGTKVAENKRQTGQEVQKDLYESGAKGGDGGPDGLKMPEHAKLLVQSLNNEIQNFTKDMTKGISEGNLDTELDPKNPSAYKRYQALLAQRRAIEMRRDKVFEQYQAPTGPRADPIGLYDKADKGDGSGNTYATSDGKNLTNDRRKALILEAMRQNGDVDADTNIGGVAGRTVLQSDGRGADLPARAATKPADKPVAAQQSRGMLDTMFDKLKEFQSGNESDGMLTEKLRKKIRAGETLTPEERQAARRLALL